MRHWFFISTQLFITLSFATSQLPTPPEAPISKVSYPSLFDDSMIVAFYGSPRSTKMGILGEHSMEETARLLKLQAAEWDALNGDTKVIPAFHLIYATIWPDGRVGLLPDSLVQKYVDYAAANNIIVILDHQLGKADPVDCVRPMLKWLKYPNVHLAIDPEWKTENPGKEIGSVKASDINKIQALMEEFLVKENIIAKKMLIVHQFHFKMIADRGDVRSDFDLVDLVHHVDGFGPPRLKTEIYNSMAKAANIPIKGFKLFYPKDWKTAGFDIPMLSPAQVLNLTPKPAYISYQ